MKRPSTLGLAVVGGEHEAPHSYTPYGGSGVGGGGGGVSGIGSTANGRLHGAQRASPGVTAVITGAGRGGWGSPSPPPPTLNGNRIRYGSAPASVDLSDPTATTPTAATSRDLGAKSPPYANGLLPSANPKGKVGGVRDRRGSGGSGSGRGDTIVPGEKSPVSPTEADCDGGRDEDGREDGEATQQQQQLPNGGGVKKAAGLARQGSKLWQLMRWNGGGPEAETEEDPAADRRAMKEAIAAGRDHVRDRGGEGGRGGVVCRCRR